MKVNSLALFATHYRTIDRKKAVKTLTRKLSV